MKATFTWVGALLVAVQASSFSFADEPNFSQFPQGPPQSYPGPMPLPPGAWGPSQVRPQVGMPPAIIVSPPVPPNYSPVFRTPLGVAPDALGGGFYTVCPDATAFGPNYNVYPPFPPFSGVLPQMFSQGAMNQAMQQAAPHPATFTTNPFVRSPRDFFMWREVMEDRLSKELRPTLYP